MVCACEFRVQCLGCTLASIRFRAMRGFAAVILHSPAGVPQVPRQVHAAGLDYCCRSVHSLRIFKRKFSCRSSSSSPTSSRGWARARPRECCWWARPAPAKRCWRAPWQVGARGGAGGNGWHMPSSLVGVVFSTASAPASHLAQPKLLCPHPGCCRRGGRALLLRLRLGVCRAVSGLVVASCCV